MANFTTIANTGTIANTANIADSATRANTAQFCVAKGPSEPASNEEYTDDFSTKLKKCPAGQLARERNGQLACFCVEDNAMYMGKDQSWARVNIFHIYAVQHQRVKRKLFTV